MRVSHRSPVLLLKREELDEEGGGRNREKREYREDRVGEVGKEKGGGRKREGSDEGGRGRGREGGR